MKKVLMKGNEALAEGAILAGCKAYFGYPITPSSEIAEYMARCMPKIGGVFLQAESEVASINMVYGGSAAGFRVMTASSSPGISLMSEGISYIAQAELPCLIVNISRGGPGLGAIVPSQSDYFQATKGGGHGDYNMIVLAPSTVQEMMDYAIESFRLADKYRNPVMLMADGTMGQMMEPIIMREPIVESVDKPWAANGCVNRDPNAFNTFFMQQEPLEAINQVLWNKSRLMEANEKKAEAYMIEDAELVIVAFGLLARVAKKTVQEARKIGIKAGLVRPITLWPFPDSFLNEVTTQAKHFLVAEMNYGQMIEDVKIALNGRTGVDFFGKIGVVPSPEELFECVKKVAEKEGLA